MVRPPSNKEQITIRLEKRQLELIQGLDDMYGSSDAEKIRQIVTIFLHEHAADVRR